MLEGRHPRRGTVLGSGRTGVAAFDLTFSAPKSASVLFGLGGPEVAVEPLIMLPFFSSAIVPAAKMGQGIRQFAEFQPFTPKLPGALGQFHSLKG